MNSIPPALKDTLRKLDYIGMTPVGKKPNVDTMTFSDAKSWFDAGIRALMRENKIKVAKTYDSWVEQGIIDLDAYKDTEFAPLLKESLLTCITGLNNVADTYCDYPRAVTTFHGTIKNIRLQLDRESNSLNPSGAK